MSQKKAFFNIHASKSMGTSLCDTFGLLKYKTTESHNCNYEPSGLAPRNTKNWPNNCQNISCELSNYI